MDASEDLIIPCRSPFWKAPYTIINLAETGKLFAWISLTTLMELRFLLRRKKAYSHHKVEEDLTALTSVVDVIIPDEMSLVKDKLSRMYLVIISSLENYGRLPELYSSCIF